MPSDAESLGQRTRHRRWMQAAGQPDLASIIIPTCNRATLLNEAIASAAAQTYRPLEIIVVDDGSTDDTAAVVDRWQQQLSADPQTTIRYIRQDNSGVSSARNRGLIESTGEFIQFLDSDDLLHPDKLSLHISCLRPYPGCGYVFSDWTTLQEPHRWSKAPDVSLQEMDSADLYCSLRVQWVMPGVYRRRTCREAGPFCEDLVSGEDKEFNLRVLLSTDRAIYLPGVLFASRTHCSPRLTDAYQVAENRLNITLCRLRRSSQFAIESSRLDNAKLVQALSRDLSGLIVDSLELAHPEIATQAIEACRRLPVGLPRRARLSVYQLLTYLPKGVFPILWKRWLTIRRAFA